MRVFSYKTIRLGELSAKQFIVVEFKHFFSIIFYYFVGDGWQDRFHTHAFGAISIKFFGSYRYREIQNGETTEKTRTEVVKYFPRSTNHMLGPSKGCFTLLLAGPWKKTWEETKGGVTRTLTWGRKRVS